ncbi:hypothetical protein KC19_11G119200 [Ceratodon purpureus]|uniref:Letm1 RBD domain-containing protein n=1 Tax=Ceratodon purpureus TaxID=3225 RepID=A0A8T0GDJ5_CERPU|nr:hypothetical protein KC19_11G119200 [Ceratodon purpureus]
MAMDLSVCAVRRLCCGIATTGGLREVQVVRFRRERQVLGIGCGVRQGRLRGVRGVVVVAASKSAEGVEVEVERERKGALGRRAVVELADGESSSQGRSLVHALHESGRVFLVGLEGQKGLASRPWFPLKWPGGDKNAWMKALSYQAAVHSLLQAVIDIAARGDGGSRNVRVFVQRRLMDLASPLEDSIRHELSSRDPAADDWLWLEQHPLAVAKFVKFLEGDNRFINITSTDDASNLSVGSDVELLKMALSSTAALVMLGSAPVSNPVFSSMLVQAIFHLMEKLQESIPMNQVHRFCTDIGLKREFLGKFGLRAADDKKWRDDAEGEFWVYLVHQLLRGALVREGVRLRLKSRDTVEVLEKDLAVFGFFATLGRSTRAYLASKGVSDSEESLASLLRYLEGGSVLFYPQLATIPIYQLFIEVVCEEMEWLPYYPVTTPVVSHDSHGENGKVKSGVGKVEKLLAIAVAVQVCSLWVKSFVEHNVWIRQPEGIRAATFLSKSQQRLEECNEVYELVKRNGKDDSIWKGATEGEYMDRLIYQDLQERCAEEASTSGADRSGSDIEPLGTNEQLAKERRKLQEVEQLLKSVDKELQSVDIAFAKLELLVKESEDAGLAGSERLRADLDKIRSLKQDVEVLKASLKSKASAREMRILELQADQEMVSSSRIEPQSINMQDRSLGVSTENRSSQFEAGAASKNVKTFEQLMAELAELESRIQQSADQSASVRSLSQEEWERASVYEVASTTALARIDENLDLTAVNGNFFSKSIDKLKEASVDIWRGSCLLGTDVGASLVLLRRKVLGQKLTSREKKILKRTATDIASVVPIGILMLLPVTAVGHAAILAAIQKYVPALIPSAYGPQRLDVLRRLEQLREMEPETPEPAALPPSRDLDGSLRKEAV